MTSWASPADGPSVPVAAGTRLGDRYELLRPIASGGMAQVWLATDTVLDRTVAAKILHPHLATDGAFVARFRREAVASARLSHPSIVAVFDTVSSHGVEAMVMEFIDGRTLRAVLDEVGAMPVDEVLHVGISIASALDEAHRAGIVHRDIKPANIMMANDRRVLVTDFGIAKAGTDADLTVTGTLLGTAKYLSPEQVTGEPIDPRSDLYSLGVMLFEALAGAVPFRAETDAATALARLHSDPPPLRSLRPNVPPELEAIVARLMARTPDGRFPRASALQEALVRIRANLSAGPFASIESGALAAAGVGGGSSGVLRPPDPPAGTVQGPPLDPSIDILAVRPTPTPGAERLAPPQPPAAPGPPTQQSGPIGSFKAAPAGTGPLLMGGGGPAPDWAGPSARPSAPPYPSAPSYELPLLEPPGRGPNTPDTTQPELQRVRRSTTSRFVSLAGVALVAVLLVSAVLAGVGPFARESDGDSPAPNAGPLPIAGVRSFDPLTSDSDKTEKEDLVGLAIDGDETTSWRTELYRDANLGGLKAGVGLILTLDGPQAPTRIDLVTTTVGYSLDVYVGDDFSEDPASWGPPAGMIANGQGSVQLDLNGTAGSRVLVWIRDTGLTGDRYRFELAEVSVH